MQDKNNTNIRSQFEDNTVMFGSQDTIIDLLREGKVDNACEILSNLDVPSIVNLLEVMPKDLRIIILKFTDEKFFKRTALWLPNYIIQEIFEIKGNDFIIDMIQGLKDHDVSYFIVKDLTEEEKNTILNQLSLEKREILQQKFTYPKDSAGRLMHSFFISVQSTWTINQALFYIKELKKYNQITPAVHDIFITNEHSVVEGSVSLYALLATDGSQNIITLKNTNYKAIYTHTDQEEVALIFRDSGIHSAAIVDNDGVIKGVITTEDIIDVIYKEYQEDMLLLGGAENKASSRYESIFNSAKARLRWLSFNFVGALTIPIILANWGDVLQKHVIIAAMLPLSIALGGNAGAQSLAVTLRGLSLKIIIKSNMYRQITQEIIIGLINGFILGIVGFIWGSLWGDEGIIIGIIAFIAVLINVVLGAFMGVMLPLMFKKLGIDPALGSSIGVTTTIDTLGYLMVLVIASAFLL